MRDLEVPLRFHPLGRTVHVLPGTRLSEAAAIAGLPLEMPCGGEGTCGKCRVVMRPAPEPTPAEARLLSPDELARGVRLACQHVAENELDVEVPRSSLAGHECRILAGSHTEVPEPTDPPVRKVFVQLPPPHRGDDVADLARLQRAVGPLEADLDLLRQLPARLRQCQFRGTAVVEASRLLDFEPGDTRAHGCALAVDLGTTTLVAALVELATGDQRAVTSRLNPQTTCGDDVLSRILYAQRPGGLHELQQRIASAVDEMIGELAENAGIRREAIYTVAVSGNTTMQQLFCGVDPQCLGQVPFVPATSDAIQAPAATVGLHIHPRGRVYVLPVIGGFVGGDTVAGILSTRLTASPRPALLVDIGTNGEIVVWTGQRLLAASTAAGPAFEGARISQGMRASVGAIEKVVLRDGDLHLNVIGNAPPVGLCGSALIDAAAELLRAGVLTPEGRLLTHDQLPVHTPEPLRRRLLADNGKPAVVLAWESDSGHGRAVTLTQRDLRELQLASGAIRAGIAILLKRAGLSPADLDTVLLAGAFGNFIRRSNAQRIGLLPGEVPRQRIRFVGNTSLAGARWTAISLAARQQAHCLARQTEHVDLSSDPDFHATFARSMIFPQGASSS